MALKAVVDAVEARLAALWLSPPNPQVVAGKTNPPVYAVDQTGETPGDGSPFIQVQFPASSSEQISIGAPGSNVFRETGGIRLIVNSQRGGGIDDGLLWADALASLFRAQAFDGVRTEAPSSPYIDDSNDVGNYYQLSFVVPYTFDYFG